MFSILFFYDVFENALRSQLIKEIRPTDEAVSLFTHVSKDFGFEFLMKISILTVPLFVRNWHSSSNGNIR